MRIPKDMISDWTNQVDDYLVKHSRTGATRDTVVHGALAWEIAHRAGIVQAAYALGSSVKDGHIQTALEAIFYNADFVDKKRY